MRRLITAMLSLSLMLGIFAASPAAVSAACAPGVPGVQIYEWNNLSGDSKLFCGSVSNLYNYTHEQPGFCEGEFNNKWDNCTNSFKVWIPAGQCIVLYNNANYGFAFEIVDGPQSGTGWQLGAIDRNILSSFRFQTAC